MNVILAQHAGVCYGVRRALEIADEAAKGPGPVVTLGPLIHNPQAVAALTRKGVVAVQSLDEVAEGTVIIRSHGVDPAVIAAARAKGLHVLDATCPFVSTAQQCAADLALAGYSVVIVGESDHPEVAGILAHAGSQAIIVESAADIPPDFRARSVGIVVQTTQQVSALLDVVSALVPRVSELRVHNTICSATTKRQAAAAELARKADVIVVVGGHNSGNTRRLAEICETHNSRTYHVETAAEVRFEWFKGASCVGITAGASTPDEQITGVIEVIQAIPGND